MLACDFMLVAWYFVILRRTSSTNLEWENDYCPQHSKYTMYPDRIWHIRLLKYFWSSIAWHLNVNKQGIYDKIRKWMGVKGGKTRRKTKTKVIRCGAVFDGKYWKHEKGGRCPWHREEVKKDIKVCVGGHKSSHERVPQCNCRELWLMKPIRGQITRSNRKIVCRDWYLLTAPVYMS